MRLRNFNQRRTSFQLTGCIAALQILPSSTRMFSASAIGIFSQAIMPAKRMLIQMAAGDLVVPNSGTFQLSERTGVPISEYNPLISNHGFLFDPTSFEGAAARAELGDFLLQGSLLAQGSASVP